jgi:hypothetical protein
MAADADLVLYNAHVTRARKGRSGEVHGAEEAVSRETAIRMYTAAASGQGGAARGRESRRLRSPPYLSSERGAPHFSISVLTSSLR